MADRSAATAGLISGEEELISEEDMARRLFLSAIKEKPRPQGRGSNHQLKRGRSVALAEQLQQQREQVDEVQIQRQRTGDRSPLRHVTALRGVAVDVIVLQPLGIPGGKARKHQHADHRYDE